MSPKQRGKRKIRTGVVISDKMDKTRLVIVQRLVRHRLYDRVIRRISKFKVHDEKNLSKAGDKVKIMETRPISKDKRWRLIEVLK